MIDRSKPEPRAVTDAVIFDLDGTLVNSVGDLTAALVEFLRPQGFPAFTDQAVKRWMGTDADDIIAGLMADFSVVPASGFDLARCAGEFLDFYDDYPHDRSVAFDGAANLLRDLTFQGIKVGICTNKRETLSRAILSDLDLMDFVGAIAGSDTTDHKKPHPAPLLHVLDQLRVPPRNAIMVGDSISDIRVGRAAGVRLVVAAAYGYPRRPEELDGADCRIGALGEIRSLVEMAGL